jgi:hypothetical protein
MPPADSEQARIACRIFAWLIMAGWPAEQVLQVAGISFQDRDETGAGSLT